MTIQTLWASVSASLVNMLILNHLIFVNMLYVRLHGIKARAKIFSLFVLNNKILRDKKKKS